MRAGTAEGAGGGNALRRYIHGKDVFEAFYKKDLVRLHVRLCCHRTWGMTDVADISTECEYLCWPPRQFGRAARLWTTTVTVRDLSTCGHTGCRPSGC